MTAGTKLKAYKLIFRLDLIRVIIDLTNPMSWSGLLMQSYAI